MDTQALKKKVEASVDELFPELAAISDDIFENPEIKFEEFHACKVITELLERHGMQVERETAGLPTAFAAHIPGHQRAPRVGILSEYDALPGIGHACGHNIIGTSGVGAFLALASIADELNGSVSLYGTPAEEGGGGKVTMLEQDTFDGLDAVIMSHPSNGMTSVDTPFLASTAVFLTFHGKPSHAAAAPTEGINALDAAVMTYVAVNGLRQRLPKDINIAGIFTHGGDAVNVIPDRAQLHYNIRGEVWQNAEQALEQVIRVANGAAEAIGATVEVEVKKNPFAEFQFYTEYKQNTALQDIFRRNLESLGIEVTEWAPSMGTGSTDFANVSMEIPGMHLMLKLDGVERPPHTVEFAEAAGSEHGKKWLRQAILTMAFSTIDILNGDGTLESIKQDFKAAS
jgi:amidohydrolase